MTDFEQQALAKLQEMIELLSTIRVYLRDASDAAPKAPSSPASASGGATGSGATFPNYGRSKGQPVAGATKQDLEYYAAGCRRTLSDPAKGKYHDKERALLAAIEAELARQSGGGGGEPPDFRPADDEIPFITSAGVR